MCNLKPSTNKKCKASQLGSLEAERVFLIQLFVTLQQILRNIIGISSHIPTASQVRYDCQPVITVSPWASLFKCECDYGMVDNRQNYLRKRVEKYRNNLVVIYNGVVAQLNTYRANMQLRI